MDKRKFILELAALLDTHGIAICSKREGDYSSVNFQTAYFSGRETKEVFSLGRCHNTAYDLRGWADSAEITGETPKQREQRKLSEAVKEAIEMLEKNSSITKDLINTLKRALPKKLM